MAKTLAEIESSRSQDADNVDNPFGRGNLYNPVDVANIQVLIAKEGDRISPMLSAKRPITEQLEDFARKFGEKHVTVNGEPYSKIAAEQDLERRGDAALPFAAGLSSSIQQYDPDQKIEADLEAGIHNADAHVGDILPEADLDPTGSLAAEARRRREEQQTLDKALEQDEQRKSETASQAQRDIDNQLSRQQAEQAGESTGAGSSGDDARKTAAAQEQMSDAQLNAIANYPDTDEGRAARAEAMAKLTNEEREELIRRGKLAPELQAATRDVNQLSVHPTPMVKGSSRHDAVNGTVQIAGKTVRMAEIVGNAQEHSGKTASEWNDMDDEDRAAAIDSEIEDRKTAAGEVENRP